MVPEGGRYCAAHVYNNLRTRVSRDREIVRRATGLKRLYDGRQWRSITRPFVLARDPLCRLAIICGGRAPSVDVDHIVRAELYIAQHGAGNDWTWFYDGENLRGACHACHARKTSLESRGQWQESMAVDPDESS